MRLPRCRSGIRPGEGQPRILEADRADRELLPRHDPGGGKLVGDRVSDQNDERMPIRSSITHHRTTKRKVRDRHCAFR
jgi:hypothetical protein